MSALKPRLAYLAAALAIVAVGLTTRLPLIHWPDGIAKYPGSVLWGAMVYCVLRVLAPSARIVHSTVVAAIVAALVEVSQLWHPRWFDVLWLDAIRSTTIGVLLLGRYFAGADIAAYVVGILVAAAIDAVLQRLLTSSRSAS